MASYKRVNEPTPGGGSYSEVYYLDQHGNIVDESVAERCCIRECAADGSLLQETYGIIDRSSRPDNVI